ncbi:MAG TPA: aldo/keto reductase [Thermoanaerobaculia bacterium]|nr:aldo/keto reductase [Thermoanaerobaculia bacterium]
MPSNKPTRRDVLGFIGAAGIAAAGSTPAFSRSLDLIERRIPSSREAIPAVGLGTWQTFDVGSQGREREAVREVLREFVALGGKVIDSSPMYGRSESVVGELGSELDIHSSLFLATKVWTEGRQRGIDQMEESVRRLRARRIDLMQVHNLVDVDIHLKTLAGWKAKGIVRYVGVTHYVASAFPRVERLMKDHPLDFIQINYSIADRAAAQRILPLAAERGIAVLVNQPFGGGRLFSTVASKPLPPEAASIGCSTWAQFFLKFILGHPSVTCVIPATSKVSHLRDNMGAGRGALPDEETRKKMIRAFEKL